MVTKEGGGGRKGSSKRQTEQPIGMKTPKKTDSDNVKSSCVQWGGGGIGSINLKGEGKEGREGRI